MPVSQVIVFFTRPFVFCPFILLSFILLSFCSIVPLPSLGCHVLRMELQIARQYGDADSCVLCGLRVFRWHCIGVLVLCMGLLSVRVAHVSLALWVSLFYVWIEDCADYACCACFAAIMKCLLDDGLCSLEVVGNALRSSLPHWVHNTLPASVPGMRVTSLPTHDSSM